MERQLSLNLNLNNMFYGKERKNDLRKTAYGSK